MHRLLRLLAATAVVAGILSFSPDVTAQGDPQNPALSLHDKARDKFEELHRRMQKLQTVKQATEPEQSRLLQTGNRFIQEERIHEGMKESRKLIEAGDYDEAFEAMARVGEDLTKLLDLLLNRDLELERLLERIKELEDFRDRVDELIEEQKAEKDDAAEAEKLLKHLESIEEAKEQVEKLIDEQAKLRSETNDAGMSAAPAKAKEMSESEGELKEGADDLAKKIEKIEKDAKELGEKKESKPGESGKPGEGEGEGEGGGAGQGGGEGQGKGGKGCEACESASKSMQQAQNKLKDNQPERSLEDMDKALDKLEATKEELDKLADEARRQLQQIPFDQQTRNQTETRIDTDKLAQDMEAAEKGEDGEQGQPTPGKQNVQQAVPKQKAAAGQLKEYKPAKAKQDQQDAADDLEKAKQDLEDALAQLRQQLEDEVLRALEERFGEMLARQKEISARTKAVDRVAQGSLTAARQVPVKVKNTCGDLSNGEVELGGEASDALKLLEEDGRSAAFPMIVEEMRDDLNRVGDRLAVSKCSMTTQMMQSEIEATLNDLINALRKTIEDRAGGT